MAYENDFDQHYYSINLKKELIVGISTLFHTRAGGLNSIKLHRYSDFSINDIPFRWWEALRLRYIPWTFFRSTIHRVFMSMSDAGVNDVIERNHRLHGNLVIARVLTFATNNCPGNEPPLRTAIESPHAQPAPAPGAGHMRLVAKPLTVTPAHARARPQLWPAELHRWSVGRDEHANCATFQATTKDVPPQLTSSTDADMPYLPRRRMRHGLRSTWRHICHSACRRMPEQTAGPNTSVVCACVVMRVWICAVRLVVVGACRHVRLYVCLIVCSAGLISPASTLRWWCPSRVILQCCRAVIEPVTVFLWEQVYLWVLLIASPIMLALVGARIYEYDEGGLAYWKSPS